MHRKLKRVIKVIYAPHWPQCIAECASLHTHTHTWKAFTHICSGLRKLKPFSLLFTSQSEKLHWNGALHQAGVVPPNSPPVKHLNVIIFKCWGCKTSSNSSHYNSLCCSRFLRKKKSQEKNNSQPALILIDSYSIQWGHACLIIISLIIDGKSTSSDVAMLIIISFV